MEISENQNINEFVTEKLINDLKAGRIPWRRPFTPEGMPFNPVSKQHYLGINQLLLASLGYPLNYFLTFKQVKEMNAKVRPGERGHDIVTWKKGEAEGEKSKMLTYPVFNIDQIDLGEEFPGEFTKPEPPENPYRICEEIASNMPDMPKLIHTDSPPYYDNFRDCIYMPPLKSFKDRDNYFFALFAELVMSTGNEKRLNRKEVSGQYAYDSRQYALRDLTAEFGAWQLSSFAGIRIPQPGYSSAYIQQWIEKLERDRYLVVNAAINAQKAVSYLLNHSDPEAVPETVPESAETDDQEEKKERKSGRKKSGANPPESLTH